MNLKVSSLVHEKLGNWWPGECLEVCLRVLFVTASSEWSRESLSDLLAGPGALPQFAPAASKLAAATPVGI
jgi:hypothetical protein